MRFADDFILFAQTEEKLKVPISELNTEGKRDAMKMNERKTKIVCNDIARRRKRNGISIDGEQLEEVEECK